MFEAFLNGLDRRRRAVWLITGVAVLASVYFLSRLEILDSPERWMPASTQDAWEHFDSHFEVGDTIAIGIHFRRPVNEQDLPKLVRLREQLSKVPGIRQVYDASLVATEIEAVPLSKLLDPANAGKYKLYSVALWDAPDAKDESRTLVTVCETAVFEKKEINGQRRKIVAEVQRIVAEEKPHWDDKVDFHLASAIVLMAELEHRARQVAFTFLPVSIAVGMISLFLSFRSWRTLVVAVGSSGLAILLVMGWIGAGGGTLGVVTVGTPALISIVVVASTMHFAAYSSEYGSTGEGGLRPKLVRYVAVPCLGAAATTAVGFLMLRFNELDPVRDLGTQLFVGSLLAFYAVFVLTQLVPIRDAHAGVVLTHRRFRKWAVATTHWPAVTSLALTVVAALLVYGAWPRPADEPIGLYVDADPFSFFADDQPIAKALNHFSERKFGVYQLEVVLVPREIAEAPQSGGPPGKDWLANQASAHDFSKKITDRADLGVLRVVSTEAFHDRQREFKDELLRVQREEGLLAAGRKLARLSKQMSTFSKTFQSWSVDKKDQGALRLTFLAHDQGARGFAPLLEYTRANLPTDRYECHLCGSIAQIVQLGEGLSGGMLSGLGLSVIIIAVLCGAMFKNPLFTLLALPPNLFPILVLYGMMGWCKIPISSGSAMVATIALGIAVNDTMHFILHYKRLTRDEGHSVRDGVILTIDELGRPIVLTSLVHIAGFSVFLLTDFLPLYHFGLLASAAMVAALAGDLLMLPNLLLLFDRHRASETKSPIDAPHLATSREAAVEEVL